MFSSFRDAALELLPSSPSLFGREDWPVCALSHLSRDLANELRASSNFEDAEMFLDALEAFILQELDAIEERARGKGIRTKEDMFRVTLFAKQQKFWEVIVDAIRSISRAEIRNSVVRMVIGVGLIEIIEQYGYQPLADVPTRSLCMIFTGALPELKSLLTGDGDDVIERRKRLRSVAVALLRSYPKIDDWVSLNVMEVMKIPSVAASDRPWRPGEDTLRKTSVKIRDQLGMKKLLRFESEDKVKVLLPVSDSEESEEEWVDGKWVDGVIVTSSEEVFSRDLEKTRSVYIDGMGRKLELATLQLHGATYLVEVDKSRFVSVPGDREDEICAAPQVSRKIEVNAKAEVIQVHVNGSTDFGVDTPYFIRFQEEVVLGQKKNSLSESADIKIVSHLWKLLGVQTKNGDSKLHLAVRSCDEAAFDRLLEHWGVCFEELREKSCAKSTLRIELLVRYRNGDGQRAFDVAQEMAKESTEAPVSCFLQSCIECLAQWLEPAERQAYLRRTQGKEGPSIKSHDRVITSVSTTATVEA